jgi:hypothetical protein
MSAVLFAVLSSVALAKGEALAKDDPTSNEKKMKNEEPESSCVRDPMAAPREVVA